MGTLFRLIRGGWIDHFIPASIQADSHLTPESLVRTRGMVAILGISIMLPLLVLIAFVILHAVTDQDFSNDIVALLITETVLVSQHIYFQSYGNLRTTAAAYSSQYLFAITVVILVSGGWEHSPLLILLISSPLIAFITMSNRAALCHVALVFIIVASLLFIQLSQIPLPNIGQEGNHPYTLFVSWVITLTFMAIFLVFSEHLVRETTRPRK